MNLLCQTKRLSVLYLHRHYAKGYFFVDLITSIPYTWFYSGRILQPGPDTNYTILILEFLPILKIIRMPTVRYNIRQINAVINNYVIYEYLYKYIVALIKRILI